MMKIVVTGVLALAIFGCVMGVVTADVFVYILCFAMLVAAILFGLLNLTINFMWKLLPADFRKTPKGKRGRFRNIILFCIFLFLFLRAVISKNCLPDAQGLIGLLSNTAIFILTVFWGWRLIRPNKIGILVSCNFIFILFIALLAFFNSINLQSDSSEDIHSIDKLASLGYLSWVPAKTEWTNYRVRCKLRSEAVNDIGLMFCVQDKDNYYRFSWNSQYGYSRLIKMADGVATLLDSQAGTYTTGKTYNIEIITKNHHLEVYVDSVLWLTATDKTFSSGSVGLYSWGNKGAYFDDIVIELPEANLPENYTDNFNDGNFAGWSVVDEGTEMAPSNWSALMGIMTQTTHIYSEPTTKGTLEKKGTFAWHPPTKNVIKTGVTQYNPESAVKGVNIYKSRDLPEAYLIDMHGNTVHKWDLRDDGGSDWHHVEMCENGDLLAVALDQMLVRLDWNSNVKWKKKMRAHHDVSIDENKRIYAIGREDRLVFWHNIPVPILSDYILVLSPNGEPEKKIHLYDLMKKQTDLYDLMKKQISLSQVIEIYFDLILKPRGLKGVINHKIKDKYICGMGTVFDIMHTNSIEIMDRDIDAFCKKGDWLISIWALDLVGLIDSKKNEFTWSWGPGELDKQHHPTLLKNGNVLIFDNGRKRQFSRIVELNPLTKKIVWEYKSMPLTQFHSNSRGCSQRLPNGNTLITDSNKGHVFEITNEGEIVWEFYNPDVDEDNNKRAAIYRMSRIVNPQKYPRLEKWIE
jgi:hypothetical protein